MNKTVLPSSPEAEAALLGCMLEDPAYCWPILDGEQVNAGWFYDLRYAEVFRIASELRAEGKPFNEFLLSERLKACASVKFETIDVASLRDLFGSVALVHDYLETIRTCYRRRTVMERAVTLGEIAADATLTEDELISRATGTLKHIERTISANTLTTIIEACQFKPDCEPPPLRPIYTLNRSVICTPGNLATITAAPKAGKSSAVAAMIAAVITGTDSESDCLGFYSRNPDGRAVLHFDTEQSKEDHWHLVKRAQRRARATRTPEWLLSYCLTGKSARECLSLIRDSVSRAGEQFGGIHSILIDGVADLVVNVNDPEETNAFVTSLHALAMEKDCPIVGVIHLNPGSEKTRGHLGSQLERKAETNLRLEKDGETSVMWSDKQRRAPIPKELGPRFQWSEQSGMHVSVECARDSKEEVKLEQARLCVADIFKERPAMRYTDLVFTLTERLRVSDKTAQKRINEWSKSGVIEKTFAGLWTPKV